MNDRLGPILQKVAVLAAEIEQKASHGPRFCIVHRFRKPGVRCLPGEEIAHVVLVWRGRESALPLPLALRILFDYLASQRFAQSAAQIEAGIRADAFYMRHGANAGKKQLRRVSRSSVREYVRRIRIALNQAFREARLNIDPGRVIASEKTVGNEVRYKLRAIVKWEHQELRFLGPERKLDSFVEIGPSA